MDVCNRIEQQKQEDMIILLGEHSTLTTRTLTLMQLNQASAALLLTASVLFVLNTAPSVLFFLLNASRTSPSHSIRLMGGGGWRGSMRTTLESTLGGGRKLLRPTLSRCDTLQARASAGFKVHKSIAWNVLRHCVDTGTRVRC